MGVALESSPPEQCRMQMLTSCAIPGLWTHENALASLQSSSLAIYTRPKDQGGLGWSVEELDVLLAAVRKDLRNPAIHGYWQMYAPNPQLFRRAELILNYSYVVYAKKPE